MRVALWWIINVNNRPLLLILFSSYSRKILSSSVETIFSKPMAPRWVPKWQSRLPTSSWHSLKKKLLGKAKQNRENGNVILAKFSLYGTTPNRKFTCSLNKLTIFILRSNLRLKFQKSKPHSRTQSFIKGIHSETTPSSTSVLIASRLKHFSTHISPRVTHQA